MKIFSNLIFIALGIIIASTLNQYTQIPTPIITYIGIGLLLISLGLSFISHKPNSAPKQSKQSRKKPSQSKPKPEPKPSSNAPLVKGNVKWYNKSKGFGFITQENGSDVFVHQSALASKTGALKDGQAVTMQVVIDEKNRPQAENVKKI